MRLDIPAGFRCLCCVLAGGGNTLRLGGASGGLVAAAGGGGGGCLLATAVSWLSLDCLGGVGDDVGLSVLALRRQADVTLVAVSALDLRRLAGRPCNMCITPSSWCRLIT